MRCDHPLVDPRLTRLGELCAALPETTRELSGRHAVFRVRRRSFAYYIDDHRGNEGIVGVVWKAAPGEVAVLLEADPARFFRPAYVGPRGWLGLRLDAGAIDWDEVAGFVTESYLAVAPRGLTGRVEAGSSSATGA